MDHTNSILLIHGADGFLPIINLSQNVMYPSFLKENALQSDSISTNIGYKNIYDLMGCMTFVSTQTCRAMLEHGFAQVCCTIIIHIILSCYNNLYAFIDNL